MHLSSQSTGPTHPVVFIPKTNDHHISLIESCTIAWHWLLRVCVSHLTGSRSPKRWKPRMYHIVNLLRDCTLCYSVFALSGTERNVKRIDRNVLRDVTQCGVCTAQCSFTPHGVNTQVLYAKQCECVCIVTLQEVHSILPFSRILTGLYNGGLWENIYIGSMNK